MTRIRELLGPLVVAMALAACTGSSTVVVANSSPPANRFERVEYRPGYVFIQGHWGRRGSRSWAWIPGHYERERPGFVYIEGRWRNDRSGHVWVDGQWRRRGGVVIRERR